MKIPHTVLERWTLHFSSYKKHKLKAKLWWVGTLERKKRAFFVLFILSKEISFNICVVLQCRVYRILFQNIHTFTCKKRYFIPFCCLFFKPLKAFSVSLTLSTFYIDISYQLYKTWNCVTFYHSLNRFAQANDNCISTSQKWFNIEVNTRSTWFHLELNLP